MGNKDHAAVSGKELPEQRILGAIFLMLVSPVFVIMIILAASSDESVPPSDGILSSLSTLYEEGVHNYIYRVWPNPFDPVVLRMLSYFSVFELVLQRFVPGKQVFASVTRTGWRPVYTDNGLASYILSLIALGGVYQVAPEYIFAVYDKMANICSTMNLFALAFVFVLMLKGLFVPSTADCGSTGSYVLDYYWGTELYPNILGWDVKQFTNCRFGMMFWQMAILCFALKQVSLDGYLSNSMLVSVILQSVYIFKFFVWETGYFSSMDIQHDRAGFYICWGCLVYLPSTYTIHTFVMVENAIDLPPIMTAAFIGLGLFCIWVNYDADRQRQDFRATNGKLKVWGQDPEYIVASYTTDKGPKKSLLLCSGWWGISRHFHYIPEIAAATLWCTPLGTRCIIPWFYPIYLTILLFDRAWRDDVRCREKYQESWDQYCSKVPYRIIPGVF